MMKKFVFVFTLILFSNHMNAQGTTYDINVNDLPKNVKAVLESYVSMLRSAGSLDDAAKQFTMLAGGSLVNESSSSISLRSSVMPYSLKKDYENIKFYADPIIITRVNSNPTSQTSGFGDSAIKGRIYKIWIKKKEGVDGLPAPVSIMVPEGHPVIKDPKVISIGSF